MRALALALIACAAASMEEYTMLLSGMDFKEGAGFLLVAGSEVPGAELLLDAGCGLVPQGTNRTDHPVPIIVK